MSQIFTADLKTVRLLLSMIRHIQFRPLATVNIHEEGLTFTVMEHHSIRAIVYAKRVLFEQYGSVPDDVASFDIPLNTLVDCLGILCPPGAPEENCHIKYAGIGSPLELIREDKEVNLVNSCTIATLETEVDMVGLSINEDNVAHLLVTKSAWLQDALGDFDSSCEKITMQFSNEDPCFQLYGTGANGMQTITEYYENGSDPFIEFSSSGTGLYRYLYSHISRCTKALSHATEVTLRIAEDGILDLLFKIGSYTHDDAAYVRFTIAPSIN